MWPPIVAVDLTTINFILNKITVDGIKLDAH